MDSRILEKINKLKEDEEKASRAKEEAEAALIEQNRLYVELKVEAAEKWIDSYLLDEIARVSLVPSLSNIRSIRLDETGDIPVLSKVKALRARNFDGITIKEHYVPEDYDPNDESHRTIIPAHREYYVTWSVNGI
jgi:hypothetical protein